MLAYSLIDLILEQLRNQFALSKWNEIIHEPCLWLSDYTQMTNEILL